MGKSVPTASNWRHPDNFARTVDYCARHLPRGRLLGFLQTVWLPTTREYRDRLYEALEVMRPVISRWSRDPEPRP